MVQIFIVIMIGIKLNLLNNMLRGINDLIIKFINGEIRRRILVNIEQSNGVVRVKIDKVMKIINNEIKLRELFNIE